MTTETPKDFASLISNPKAIAEAFEFLAALKNLKVLTVNGDMPLMMSPGATNCVLDLRSLTATGAPPANDMPSMAGYSGYVLGTNGTVPGWVLRNGLFTHVRRAASQSINSGGGFTQVIWDTAVVNNDGIWDSSAPTLFTIQSAGLYLISGWMRYDINATGIRYCYTELNSTSIAVPPDTKNATGGGEYTYGNSFGFIRLAAGDTIRLNAYQTSGGALNLLTAGGSAAEMYAMRLTD